MRTDETDDAPETRAPAGDDEKKYRAPALEKGLDIIELLSAESGAMTSSQIAGRLGKSLSEIFRMLQVLEYRGYIAVDDAAGGYALTDRLFALGLNRAPTKSLLSAALPVMEELARRIGQSCHLVVASSDQIVVVARVESPGDLGFSVRVGYRRNIVDATSGLILYGFQPPDAQEAMRRTLAPTSPVSRLQDFIDKAKAAAERGFAMAQSDFVHGVTDVSAPVMGPRGALAALTVPFLYRSALPCNVSDASGHVCEAARKVSSVLSGAEVRQTE